MLLIAAACIMLAFALGRRDDGRVILRGLPSLPLPESCASQSIWGVHCPGCGLTRSFIALARGDWSGAAHEHRLGWLMAAAVWAQVPYRIAALRLRRPPLGRIVPRVFGYGLIAALLINWLV